MFMCIKSFWKSIIKMVKSSLPLEVELEVWKPKEEGVFKIVCLLGTLFFYAICMYTFLRNVCFNIDIHTHTFTYRKIYI